MKECGSLPKAIFSMLKVANTMVNLKNGKRPSLLIAGAV